MSFFAKPQPDMSQPIEKKSDLVTYLEQGSREEIAFRIGTEHEKFCFYRNQHSPVPYHGSRGIRALLTELEEQFDWHPVIESSNIVGLYSPERNAAISLEPGGQFELSGAPVETIHQTAAELECHFNEIQQVGKELGIGFLGLGFSPKWTLEEIPMMPKKRYEIMTRYMPHVGSMGLDMMYRSCTVQANLDFSSESDMVKKMRVALGLQPVAVALFANSPFSNGVDNGFRSWRMEVWRHTDQQRAGNIPFVFDGDMGFERYVDYALDIPMYFVLRDGVYIEAGGQSFRDFMKGMLRILPGQRPFMNDWMLHLSTIFPDVRLKPHLEIRGADSGSKPFLCAAPALWVGLLYDQDVLDAVWDMIKGWTLEEHRNLYENVPCLGLATPFRKGTLQDIGRQVVELAQAGLKKRCRLNEKKQDETIFLDVLEEVASSGTCPADHLLCRFRGEWKHSIEPLFEENAF